MCSPSKPTAVLLWLFAETGPCEGQTKSILQTWLHDRVTQQKHTHTQHTDRKDHLRGLPNCSK